MPWNIFKQILFCTSQIWESQALSIGEKMGAGKSLISVLWLLVAKRLYGTARALGTWGVKNLEDCKRSVEARGRGGGGPKPQVGTVLNFGVLWGLYYA